MANRIKLYSSTVPVSGSTIRLSVWVSRIGPNSTSNVVAWLLFKGGVTNEHRKEDHNFGVPTCTRIASVLDKLKKELEKYYRDRSNGAELFTAMQKEINRAKREAPKKCKELGIK